MGVIAALAIGAAAVAGGSVLNANAAKKRQKFYQYIADTPGVDIGKVYGETLGAAQGATPQAEALAGQQNTFNQSEKDRMLNADIPGFEKAQAQRIRNAQSDLEGVISPEVSAQISRRGAASGVESGTGGSGFNRNLVARDFGLTSMDLQQRGANEFASIIGTTPMAGRVTSGSFLNIDPKTGLALRENERQQKMNILLGKAGLKGATETYGGALTQIGGALLSSGMGGMGGGGGAMGGGGGGGGALSNAGGTWGGGNYYNSSLYQNGGPSFGG